MDRVRLLDILGFEPTGEQLDAITAPLTPGLIVAGAGSGKTTVMAARVVWLVGTEQVEPGKVVGLTFTNKAAAELAHRVTQLLRRAELPLEDEPRISTYHAFAGRLVADHGLRLGLEPRSRLLADATRFQLAARVLRRRREPLPDLTGPFTDLVGKVVSLDSELSEHLVDPSALREWEQQWQAELALAIASYDGEKGVKTHVEVLEQMALVARRRMQLADVVSEYRRAKRELDALDFGEQVAFAARLAETVPEVAELERAAADVVLLDEYQDTSVAQRRLLVGLYGGGHPVTAVGDPCQAIYGWRGASVSNLDGFPAHFAQLGGAGADRHSLAVNQRSGGRLLQLANTLSRALRDRHAVVELTAPPAKVDLGEVRVALHTTWAEEVAWVAEEVVRASEDTPWEQIAVLVRARKDFAPLHAALVARDVPVEVVGLGGLLALPEVADVVAVLDVIEDPTANGALIRLLTGPRWRLGPRDLAQLGRRGRALLRTGIAASDAEVEALERAVEGIDPCDVVSLSDALERPGHDGWSPEGLTRVTSLAAELRLLRSHRDEPLLDLVHRVVEVTGLDVELSASPEALAARRREALASFLDVVADFTDLDGETSLTSFLAFLRAADEHERGLDSTGPTGSKAVQLLTAHKAKGLEWDVVVVPDLTKGVFPNGKARESWATNAHVLPGPLRGDAADQPVLDTALTKQALKDFKTARDQDAEREERRLGYVAFTRPRRLLVGSGHWWGPTQSKPRGPSAFLVELREHAEAGHGTVQAWAEEPAEERNPGLAERPSFDWPAAYDPEPFARRTAAADQVRAFRDHLALGTPLPEDVGLSPGERALFERLDTEAKLLLDEERAARNAVREVHVPVSLSASQLMRLAADEQAFAHELARPMPRPPAPAARRGTRFHAWVEGLFDERPLLDPDDLPGSSDDDEADGDLEVLQEAFLASPWATRKPYAVEARFALPLAGRIINGYIDAVYDLGGGRWQVVDWKTGKEGADPVQLAVYRLAWARLQGADPSAVDASFVYVRTGREVVHTDLVGPEELVALLTGTVSAQPLTLL